MIKGVVFDLDGTLLDTLMDLKEALNHTLKHYGYQSVTLDDVRVFIGNGIRKLIERACHADEETLDEMFLYFKEFYKENYNVHTKPYDGILEVLEYLKGKNVCLGVVSNKAAYALHPLCHEHFPSVFTEIIGDGEGYKRKPSSEPLNEICRRFGILEGEMVYIGDGVVDYETIKATGCQGIIVSYGFKSEADLKAAGIDRVCRRPIDLIEMLEELL